MADLSLGASTPQPAVGSGRAGLRTALVVTLCLLSGALGGGGVFAGLELSGSLGQAGPAGTQQVTTMPVPDVPGMLAGLRPSVVTIDVDRVTTDASGQQVVSRAAGTGFVIDPGGLIATNAHVVADAGQVRVTFSDGAESGARVAGADVADDLAVLKVARTGLSPVRFGSSGALRVGQMVVAVGNALALQGGPTASLGIVSALDRSIQVAGGATYQHLIQTDAAINSGDSGGPLVEADGQIVGINTAAATSAENIGFAIAVDQALPILSRLAQGFL